MEKQDRKDAIRAYKERRPEMGVIEFLYEPTGERFARAVSDTKDINSQRFQLDAGLHPNKRLQTLWAKDGGNGFRIQVDRVLDYRDPQEDHSQDLETLLELYYLDHPDAERL